MWVRGCGLLLIGNARQGLELDFAGFAIAGLNGVNNSGAACRADNEAIDEDEDGLCEVELEKGFRGGEFDDLVFDVSDWLKEPVVAAAAEHLLAGAEPRPVLLRLRGATQKNL